MKPFDEISTNAFLEVILKCLGYVITLPFFENCFQCLELFTNVVKNVSKISPIFKFTQKRKHLFLAREPVYIGFKPTGTS